MSNTILGNFIRTMRKEKGFTLREMAEFSGISFSHLSKIERGEHQPSHDTITHLANAFNINRNEIYAMAHFTEDELIFWKDIYIQKNIGNTNIYDREKVSDLEVIRFRNEMVHRSTPDLTIEDEKGNLIYFEMKSPTELDSEKFSNYIESYEVSSDDTISEEWLELISYFIVQGLTPDEVRSKFEIDDKKLKLTEMAFDVITAQNNMFSSDVQYHYLKANEGEESPHTQRAYDTFIEAQGYYNKLFYKYMIEYFRQKNANPFEDRLLRKKFPLEYDYQRDLFGGVNVSLKCADGHRINNVAYFNGGYGGKIDAAEEKARKYIKEHLEHFKQSLDNQN